MLLAFLFRLEGESSARCGSSLLSNPYEAGTLQQADWHDGWLEGRDAVRWARQDVDC